jgi:hypothetical protein
VQVRRAFCREEITWERGIVGKMLSIIKGSCMGAFIWERFFVGTGVSLRKVTMGK